MNYDNLKQALAGMSVRSKLYDLVKAEMVKRGHWKAAPRGKAFQKGNDPHRKSL